MKRKRWVKAELIDNLAMRVTYSYGTTMAKAQFVMTYDRHGIVFEKAFYYSPDWTIPLSEYVYVDARNSPEENNAIIWRTLTDLERKYRNDPHK